MNSCTFIVRINTHNPMIYDIWCLLEIFFDCKDNNNQGGLKYYDDLVAVLNDIIDFLLSPVKHLTCNMRFQLFVCFPFVWSFETCTVIMANIYEDNVITKNG